MYENKNARPIYEPPRKIKTYTKEEKASRNEILSEIKQSLPIVEYASNVLGLTILRSRKGERYLKSKELSSLVFDLKINRVFWNKYGSKALDIIDFIVLYDGCSHSEAINRVAEYYKERDPNAVELFNYDITEDKTTIFKGIKLPEPYKNDVIATSYLLETRRISEHVINRLRENNMFYEDKYHNAVFIGYDIENNPKFGVRRGTYPSVKFQRDCEGSYKNCGFFIENKYPVKKLVLAECVIDGLSYLSLNKNLIDCHVLCSSGAGCVANTLWFNLNTRECLKDVEEIVCACDNDDAGNHAYLTVKNYIETKRPNIKLTKFTGYDGIDMLPNMDLNDVLKKVREKEDSYFINKESEEELKGEEIE